METTSNYEKYQTTNPLMRYIIQRFLNRVMAHLRDWRPRRIVDLGCGEGLVAGELPSLPFEVDYLGLEINALAIEQARRLHPSRRFVQADLLTQSPQPEGVDVVLCLEVLEHLVNPALAVERVAQWTQGRALVSVPWEPYFRIGNFLRGKYLSHLGNHPEHVQQFTPASFEALLRGSFPRVDVEICFPWLIGLCHAGGDSCN